MNVWRKAFCAVASSALLFQVTPAISSEKFSIEIIENIKPGDPKYEVILSACNNYGLWRHLSSLKSLGKDLKPGDTPSAYFDELESFLDFTNLIEASVLPWDESSVEEWTMFLGESASNVADNACQNKVQQFPRIAAKYKKTLSLESFERAKPGDAAYLSRLWSCNAWGVRAMMLVKEMLGKPLDGKGKSIFFDRDEDFYALSNKLTAKHGLKRLKEITYSYEGNIMGEFIEDNSENGSQEICEAMLLEAISPTASQSKPLAKSDERTSPPVESSDSDAHQKCLDAKDYQGCMAFATGQSQGNSDEDCPPDEWCTATKGIDPLGKPKIVGWQMLYEPAKREVTYKRPDPQKVNVRGKTDRYFENQIIVRQERDAVSAIAPKTTSYGSATTNCTGYGNSINCSTSAAPTITIPGRTGRAGGVYSYSGLILYDCKDKTSGVHVNGRLRGKWKKAEPSSAASQFLDKYCPIVNTLKTSSFTKYVND